jgi:hypothetical protein
MQPIGDCHSPMGLDAIRVQTLPPTGHGVVVPAAIPPSE